MSRRAPDPIARALYGESPDAEPAWAPIRLAVALFSVAPHAAGGLWLRGGPSPQRARILAWIRALLPPGAPTLRMPCHVTDDRLLGGLALAETLERGRVVTERGLLERADGGVLVAAMAERIRPGAIAPLSAILDHGSLAFARDGIAGTIESRFGLVALDEGHEDDEGLAASLVDRLALRLDLGVLDPRQLPEEGPAGKQIAEARGRLASVSIPDAGVDALCRAAAALGIDSLRPPLLAARIARSHAALAGRSVVEEPDLAAAASLVLAPRATRLPAPPEADEEEDAPAPPEESPSPDAPEDEPPREGEDGEEEQASGSVADRVLEAAESALPAGLLDGLSLGPRRSGGPRSSGEAGSARASSQSGRPAGTRAAAPRDGERLSLVDTLRAAAPWQTLRRRDGTRVEVRAQDFRVRRFVERTETCVVFCVDASGSAALQRLAEAKGAVETLLADCYVRRDHVALVAFRDAEASVLLPPTRSLARARRLLVGLAGGGATPIAAGLDAARALALDARRRGRTPLIVVMTDGRANVARDGTRGGDKPMEDALASATQIRADGVPTLFLDTAPRPRRRARQLAEALDARYLPLPHLDASGVSREVQAMAGG